jgi:ribosomal protein L37AE/L43A
MPNITGVTEKEQLAQMSVDEIYAAINTDLHEDAYETQLAAPKRYKGKCLAEGLENLMFICPECGKIDTFRSQNDTISCSSCGHSVKYDEYGMLNGGMYHTLREFSDWQKKLVKEHVQNGVEYTAEDSALNTVENKEEAAVASGKLRMNREVFQCGETEIPMSEIMDLAMHGQRTIVFSAKKKYYELKVAKGYNALKFMLYFNECRA